MPNEPNRLIQEMQAALEQLQTARGQWTDLYDLDQSEAWGKAARAAQAVVLRVLGEGDSTVEVAARQLSIVTVEAGLGSDEDYQAAVEELERLLAGET